MKNRPSFLLFIADQLRADHLGCYGNPVVQTPHIDRLALSSWVADRFHVASPVCMANRATLMTGRMPSVHGVRGNGYGLRLDSNTFVRVLRHAGYRTAMVGKSHLQNITGAPPLVPRNPQLRQYGEAVSSLGPGRYDQESAPAWRADPNRELDLPYYGFDAVRLSIGHGDDQEGHYRRWLRSQRSDAESLVGQNAALPTPDIQLFDSHQAWRTRVPEELYPTAWCAIESISYLETFAREGKPFFLMCSFADPHHPFTPPGKYWSMYDPERTVLPKSFHATHRNPPRQVEMLWRDRDEGSARKDTPDTFACSEREAKEAIALNYGMISCIDDAVGRVIEALNRFGLSKDTIIGFTADHGDMMGDHQLLLKSAVHYQAVLRAPFIWSDPETAVGRRSNALVGTIDIGKTVLARAGLHGFNGMQGTSLLGLIDGSTQSQRTGLLVEQESQREVPGFEPPMRMRTLISERFRMTVYEADGLGELYDLDADPDELNNLWGDPEMAANRESLLHELVCLMMENGESSPFPSGRA